jgi:hypothetical protein
MHIIGIVVKLSFKEYLNEAKYHLPVPGGWNSETGETDSRISPYERGRLAASIGSTHSTSLDYNEETDEYNPYEPGTEEYEEYERGYQEVTDYITDRFPDI